MYIHPDAETFRRRIDQNCDGSDGGSLLMAAPTHPVAATMQTPHPKMHPATMAKPEAQRPCLHHWPRQLGLAWYSSVWLGGVARSERT